MAVLLAGGFSLSQRLSINTDMTAVLPENRLTPVVDRAVVELSEDFQRRISIVVSGDEAALSIVSESLRARLATLKDVELLPDQDAFALTLIEELLPYRFHLLSKNQQAFLDTAGTDELVERALRALYGVASPRLLEFSKDPFSLHQQTFMMLAPTPAEAERAFTVVSAELSENAFALSEHDRILQAVDSAVDGALADARSIIGVNAALQFDRSGVFFFAVDAAKRSKSDITLISTLSSIAIVMLLLFVFRNLGATLLPLLSIVFGISFGVVITHWLFGELHIFTIIFGVGLIGVVIDYSLHFLYHRSSSTTGAGRLHTALALSAATSVIGYGALYFSQLTVLKTVAVFAVSGIAMSWLTVLALGPYFKAKVPRQFQFVNTLRRFLGRGLSRVPGALIILPIAALSALAAYQVLSHTYRDDAAVFFAPDAEILASERRASAYTRDFEPGRFIVITGQDEDEVYRRHAALLELVASNTSLGDEDLLSLLDWVPPASEQKANYARQARLYGPQSALDEVYRRLGLVSGAQEIRREYREAEDRYLTPAGLLELIGPGLPRSYWKDPRGIVSFVLLRKGADVEALDQLLAQNKDLTYINVLARTGRALKEQRESSARLIVLAFVMAGALLVLVYRDLRAFALISVPALSCLCTLSVLLGFGREVNLFHVMTCFLILGFGMDYMIFARQMLRDSDRALQAIVLSWVSSQLSFGLLGMSNIGMVASFGEALFLGNTGNLLGVLFYTALQERSQCLVRLHEE